MALGCGDQPSSATPDGVQITRYEFRQQLPGDPFTAIFAFYFDAPEGKMYGGKANFYVGTKSEPLDLDMADLMSAAGLGRDATRGEVGAALRFSDTVSDGATVNLSLELVDETGRKSNRATVTLKFTFPND